MSLLLRKKCCCGGEIHPCCLGGGSCVDGMTADQCTAAGGIPIFSTTSPGQPPVPVSTCQEFIDTGGSCNLPGACCLPDGSCIQAQNTADCVQQGGVFQGVGTNCVDVTCPTPVIGACCFQDGSCAETSQFDCEASGGIYQGDGTDCLTADCPQPGDCGAFCPSSIALTIEAEVRFRCFGRCVDDSIHTVTIPPRTAAMHLTNNTFPFSYSCAGICYVDTIPVPACNSGSSLVEMGVSIGSSVIQLPPFQPPNCSWLFELSIGMDAIQGPSIGWISCNSDNHVGSQQGVVIFGNCPPPATTSVAPRICDTGLNLSCGAGWFGEIVFCTGSIS